MIIKGEQVYYAVSADNVEWSILQLDLVVAALVGLTLIHATIHSNKALFVLVVAMAHVVEQSSIRLGGTHCHKPGLFNVGVCQSANSVWFYVPWFYTAFFAALRMVRKGFSPASAPLLAGVFSFAFCGAYEMQGPALGWFQWPDEHQLTYPAGGATLWQLEPDPQGRGMRVSDHAHAALLERAFGFPLAAPLYHIAMGIGLVQAVQLLHASRRLDRLNPLRTLLSLFFIGPLALLWDLPVRFLEWGGVSKYTGVPCVMALLLHAPLLFTKPSCTPAASVPSDWLLFSIPLLNSAFLCTRFWDSPGLVSPDLYVTILTVTVMAMFVHYSAATRQEGQRPTSAQSGGASKNGAKTKQR